MKAERTAKAEGLVQKRAARVESWGKQLGESPFMGNTVVTGRKAMSLHKTGGHEERERQTAKNKFADVEEGG